ncbi:hypothetical protein [Olsenella profusa]|uniref:Type VII secretion effector, TIGR04197 family n=1 Tax=Olsenella profusa F0195 TaxID=1125712 RepID=U2TLA7_9ACTN|nr:hypothetical protein [Olsenella profusa]ERL06968.1 type VII secretion effector, TIGR04197 family [Olsenella profusa F0195]
MSGSIASNMGVASQKKAEMLSALDEYVSFTTQSASGTSDGVPPADHDERAQRYEETLSKYASSLTRDADALERIGVTFQEGDELIAQSLMGIGG